MSEGVPWPKEAAAMAAAWSYHDDLWWCPSELSLVGCCCWHCCWGLLVGAVWMSMLTTTICYCYTTCTEHSDFLQHPLSPFFSSPVCWSAVHGERERVRELMLFNVKSVLLLVSHGAESGRPFRHLAHSSWTEL